MEDDQFPQEDIETIAKNAIVGTLGDCAYNAKKVGDWTNSMTDTILKELQGLNRPFKYVVTTIIMQKNGAGMDTGAAMHWDAAKDGLVCIPWENAEMHVVLTIYGVSLNVDNVGDEED
jgi:dynein light chain Tctex-type 1